MKTIPLSQGKFALVDECDFERVSQYRWCAQKHGRRWYAVRKSPRVNGRNRMILMHRFILGTPKGMDTDHINGDDLDNRRQNIRACTRSENMRNCGKSVTNTSGFKGVDLRRDGSICARIKHLGKRIYLGTFPDLISAARAYDEAAVKLHGQFARLNFPEDCGE